MKNFGSVILADFTFPQLAVALLVYVVLPLAILFILIRAIFRKFRD